MKDTYPHEFCPAPGDGGYGMYRTPSGLALAVERCLKALTPIGDTFDAIYVTGNSGTIPGAIVAFTLGKPLLVLRKSDERGNHWSHGSVLEGDIQLDADTRYIILDDFVSNGGTLRRMLRHIPKNGTLVGLVMYSARRFSSEKASGIWRTITKFDQGSSLPERYKLIRRTPTSALFDLVEVQMDPSIPLDQYI